MIQQQKQNYSLNQQATPTATRACTDCGTQYNIKVKWCNICNKELAKKARAEKKQSESCTRFTDAKKTFKGRVRISCDFYAEIIANVCISILKDERYMSFRSQGKGQSGDKSSKVSLI